MDPPQNPNPYPYHHPYPYPPPPNPHWAPPPAPPPYQAHAPPPPPYQAHGPAPPPPTYGPPIPQHQYNDSASWPHYPPPPPPPPQQTQNQYSYVSAPAPQPQPRPVQGWGSPSPSWAPYQGWENPGYTSEEDLAARAKAWAASQSASTNHLMHSQVTTVGRADEQNISVHGPYQSTAGSHTETPSFSQISNQQTSSYLMDQQKQANQLNGTASYTPTSFSFGTGGLRGYDGRDNGITTQVASPTKSFASNSSVYEQEVPYSYSLPQGHREAGGHGDTFQQPIPLPAFSVQERHAQPNSTLTESHISSESHYGGHPNTYITDASNQPLDFERPASDFEHRAKINYGFTDPAGSMGVIDRNSIAAPVNSWTPSAVPGNLPQAVVPPGIQFDLPYASQPSVAVQHPPAFGGLSGPSFGPGVPPVAAPFGLVAGATLNQSTGYSVDANGSFGIPERPKKPAVPKWIQEEIIKNKSVIASTLSSHHNESSYNSAESEDTDKPYNRDDQDDRKSFDSTKSSKDDEDDEDEVAAAKSAAVNQEIKRVLTEVLMKVTDQLFNEIATKVIDEEDQTVEVNLQNDPGNHKMHLPSASVPKAPAKAMVAVTENDDDSDSSRSKSPGGDVLGLASYASDEEDDQHEDQDSKLPTSGMIIQHRKSVDRIDTEKEDKSDTRHHNGELHDIEGERDNNGGPAFKESAIVTKVADNSMQSVSTNDSEKEVNGLPEIGKKYTPNNVSVVDTSQNDHRPKSTSGDAYDRKFEFRLIESNRISSSNKHSETRTSNEDSIRKKAIGREKSSASSETADNETRNKMKLHKGVSLEADDKISKHAKSQKSDSGKGEDRRKHEKRESSKDRKVRSKEDSPRKRQKETDDKEDGLEADDKISKHANSQKSDSGKGEGSRKHEKRESSKDRKVRSKEDIPRKRQKETDDKEDGLEADDIISKHANSLKSDSGKGEGSRKHEKKESSKDRKVRSKEDSPRKRQKETDDKERSRRASDSSRYSSSKRSPSPSSRGRTSRTSSTHVHGSGSSDEPSDNIKRRKLRPRSSSPSPTRDKSRHVSRSPNRKHSHRRHSPYSSADKRRRSRSGTPVHRRR